MMRVSSRGSTPAWKSLKTFTASTTFSEKAWRVANGLIFAGAGLRVAALLDRRIRPASPIFSYASYAAILLVVRKIGSIVIGCIAYPAAACSAWSREYREALVRLEADALSGLKMNGYGTQKISLYKAGVCYDATLVYKQDTAANGKWCIHALGNMMAMEEYVREYAEEDSALGANTLLINGPAVGRSGGWPTRYQMGAGFEAGLQFLEKEVNATHIVMKGLSLGGGMFAEAMRAHEFYRSKRYLAIFDRTFSRLSDVAAAMVARIVRPVFFLAGIQLDTVSGVRKLRDLRIPHIIIQNSDASVGGDGVIPNHAGLAGAVTEHVDLVKLMATQIRHNSDLPSAVQALLDNNVRQFFAN